MKKYSLLAVAFLGLTLASCMGDGYAEPDTTVKVPGTNTIVETAPYGNYNLTEENVISIADLKNKYKSVINADSKFETITEDIKIKGYVTGNDISGNIYQQISVQDETGAIMVCVAASGLYGYLPVGQQILISLKGLNIGGNSKLPEIGGVYTNLKKGTTAIGNMDRVTWQEHFKLMGTADASKVEPVEFDLSKLGDATYMDENVGKLMTIKSVAFREANGTNVFAPNSTNTSRYLVDYTTGKNISNTLVVRTSGYAKFANMVLPEGPYNITGIFTRYGNTWQIVIRDTTDLEKVATDKSGTIEEPYSVTKALELINGGNAPTTAVYTTGIICSVDDVSTSYGNATYKISEDGTDTSGKTITVFRGYYLGNVKIDDSNKDAFQVGKKVVVCGTLTLYGTTPEINSGNYIVSIE